MKNRYKVMFAIIALTMVTTITLFSINLAKARHVYEENIIFENVDIFDANAEGNNLYFSYVQGNNILLETRTFTDKIVHTQTITSENPKDISLHVINKVPHIIWSTDNGIMLWTGEQLITISEQGINPELFTFNGQTYAVWHEATGLYTKPVGTDAKWQITSGLSDYSIYNYQNQKIYVTYENGGMIYFKIFTGAWSNEIQVYGGMNPHIISNGFVTYVYNIQSDEDLHCFYGENDDIKLTEKLTDNSVQEIITHKDIMAFTDENGLFIQRITADGFSQAYQVTTNQAMMINCFYVDEDDLMFTYKIESRIIYKYVNLPDITEETTVPFKLEIIPSEDPSRRNAFDYIADYNLRNIEPEGRVRNFMVAHSGESLVLLGVISAGVTVGMTFIMGRRIDAKDGKRK